MTNSTGDGKRARFEVFVAFDDGRSTRFYCRSRPRILMWEHAVLLQIHRGRHVVIPFSHIRYYEVKRVRRT